MTAWPISGLLRRCLGFFLSASAQGVRKERVELLLRELRTEREAFYERSRNLEAKASYLMVANGVIISAAVISMPSADPAWFFLATLLVAIVSIGSMCVVLWPRGVRVPSGREMVREWLEGDLSRAQVEDVLLEVRTVELENLHVWHEKRANLARSGTVFLVIAVVMLTIAFTVEGVR